MDFIDCILNLWLDGGDFQINSVSERTSRRQSNELARWHTAFRQSSSRASGTNLSKVRSLTYPKKVWWFWEQKLLWKIYGLERRSYTNVLKGKVLPLICPSNSEDDEEICKRELIHQSPYISEFYKPTLLRKSLWVKCHFCIFHQGSFETLLVQRFCVYLL